MPTWSVQKDLTDLKPELLSSSWRIISWQGKLRLTVVTIWSVWSGGTEAFCCVFLPSWQVILAEFILMKTRVVLSLLGSVSKLLHFVLFQAPEHFTECTHSSAGISFQWLFRQRNFLLRRTHQEAWNTSYDLENATHKRYLKVFLGNVCQECERSWGRRYRLPSREAFSKETSWLWQVKVASVNVKLSRQEMPNPPKLANGKLSQRGWSFPSNNKHPWIFFR